MNGEKESFLKTVVNEAQHKAAEILVAAVALTGVGAMTAETAQADPSGNCYTQPQLFGVNCPPFHPYVGDPIPKPVEGGGPLPAQPTEPTPGPGSFGFAVSSQTLLNR